VLSSALTLQIFTELKVPISNSQAIVGSIAGVGFLKETRALNKRMLFSIFAGWIATPLIAAFLHFS